MIHLGRSGHLHPIKDQTTSTSHNPVRKMPDECRDQTSGHQEPVSAGLQVLGFKELKVLEPRAVDKWE